MFTTGLCRAQNLVPNPSFEEYDTCPDFQSQLNRAKGWITNINTADYFNSCFDTTVLPIGWFDVPSNVFGYQEAYTGNAYAGFLPISKNGLFPDAREYFGAQLLSPLITGNTYYVNFRISLGDYSDCYINRIGMRFTNQLLRDTTIMPPILVDNHPHIYTNDVVMNSTSWSTVSGSFIADSVYKYFLIGNFFAYQDIDSMGDWCNAYYYIDNVCISTDSLTCPTAPVGISSITNNGIEIHPNPATAKLYCNNRRVKASLCNLWGEEILPLDFTQSGEVDVTNVPNGLYVISYVLDGRRYAVKQVVMH